ncbi:MAG TPA: hypothetical protein P5081_23580, partial [Phycisphaerae bacterium]|nr:hypothetical protein [Phycisphaerae bacterium]
MYRAPGVTLDVCGDDWFVLAAAGGGGGAYQAWDLECVDGETGADAGIDTCGGDGLGSGGGSGGCNGNGGGDGGSGGGGGVFGASSEADAGCPIGGAGGPGDG